MNEKADVIGALAEALKGGAEVLAVLREKGSNDQFSQFAFEMIAIAKKIVAMSDEFPASPQTFRDVPWKTERR